MADVTLNTRFKLSYDTYANWTSTNPVLYAGEMAVTTIPVGTSVEQTVPPAVMFKVGDGTSHYNDLPWASGLAADVYEWAKQASKPTYTATEVGAETAGTAQGLINALDVANTATANQYPSAISQTDGVISVTWTDLPTADEYTLEAGGANGTVVLKKNGEIVGAEVKVKGLGSAAFTESSAYDAAGTAASAVATHNTSGTAHADIRSDITELQNQIQGLTGAMHFIGVSTTDPSTGTATVEGHEEFEAGDVCLYGQKEYVYTGTAWVELGDEGSYLTKTEAASTYVTKTTTVNGKALSSNIELTAADVDADAAGTAQSLINALDTTVSVGTSAQTLASLTQTNGVIAATFQNIQITQDQVTGLPAALSAKQDALTFDGTYNASTNKVATQSTVTSAIAALDFTDSAVSGQYVSAVSQENGVISVTRATLPTAPTFAANNGLAVTNQDGTVTYGISLTDTFILDGGSAADLA